MRHRLARPRAGLLSACALIAWTASADSLADRPRPSEVMLVYVGADDCAPCRAWQAGDRAAFVASAEFARIAYREIKSAHVLDLLRDENWPEDMRAYRARLRPSDGVPLWFVVADDNVVEQRSGASQWRDRVLPRLKALLR